MSDKWAEQFARMEALLSRGNIFSTLVSAVKPIDTQPLISTTPFVPPATRPTGSVKVPVAVEKSVTQKKVDDKDKKKKSHKSRKHDKPVQDPKPSKTADLKPDSKPEKRRDRSASPVWKHSSVKGSHSPKAVSSYCPESVKQPVPHKGDSSLFSANPDATTVGRGSNSTTSMHTGHGQPSTGACAFPPDTGIEHYEQFSDDETFDRSEGASVSDEGQLSDTTETPEQTEEMSYRETVRSVRSYMGWHHIPTFETTYLEPDKSNNPWKGKNPRKPTRVSVAMPPDDWLCQKLERLNSSGRVPI